MNKPLAGGFIDCHRYKGTKKAPYWMPFWYRTMCEELFCISIVIYQEEDGNNKNNLLNIVKNWCSKKDTVDKTIIQ